MLTIVMDAMRIMVLTLLSSEQSGTLEDSPAMAVSAWRHDHSVKDGMECSGFDTWGACLHRVRVEIRPPLQFEQ